VIETIDADLRAVPPLESMGPTELLRILRRSHQTLTALHGHEVLAGMLLADDGAQPTAASSALRILAAVAADGDAAPATGEGGVLTDAELIARHPVLLSLSPPTIGAEVRLPPPPASLPASAPPAGSEAAVRESLRLRVRWVHELTGRVALRLGQILVQRGVLSGALAIVDLRLDELTSLVESGGSIALELRRSTEPGPPLPAAFRLTEEGLVVPLGGGRDGGGIGAGGGRGSGPVHVGADSAPSPGDVLVVRTLDPGLAPLLPGLGGLVAETGSVLSHLAILAREYGVPTVVGRAGATEAFADGTWILVDGTSGDVSPVDAGEWGAA
jgi:pyruvate,water dikinase